MENIATSRANLSGFLKQVRMGETIVILDRGQPVARFEPISDWGSENYAFMAKDLAKSGDLLPRKSSLEDDFFLMPISEDPEADVRTALIAERREGR